MNTVKTYRGKKGLEMTQGHKHKQNKMTGGKTNDRRNWVTRGKRVNKRRRWETETETHERLGRLKHRG